MISLKTKNLKNKKQIFTRIISLTFILLTVSGFIFLFLQKDNLVNYASDLSKDLHKNDLTIEEKEKIALEFNYTQNSLSFEITFLEFGSTGCVACKKMEKVLKEIQSKYPNRVNVIFHNVTKKESKIYANHFGIVAIPTQVLLDKTGKEIFRHTGYVSTEDLSTQINISINKKSF